MSSTNFAGLRSVGGATAFLLGFFWYGRKTTFVTEDDRKYQVKEAIDAERKKVASMKLVLDAALAENEHLRNDLFLSKHPESAEKIVQATAEQATSGSDSSDKGPQTFMEFIESENLDLAGFLERKLG
eukprot:CAMPEP_0201482024 /NCGR_PEP_ID=MMETSP0151_2-20130828/6266_1 /ASSEMBLY_ACC=CAM_ASM_000257 /TAXON_ID=200890 /ORGANISM="Paramoeba atlantica, Strain 621/1 / CCAP 1560/9" /LENGTH=127 /DNA_ID=CAMNT_0047864481 /DNA_START=36 /DNA_END=419 /DNA_ORIENTATION=+